MTKRQAPGAGVGSRVARGASQLLGAKVLAQLVNMAGLAVMARMLSPADYGVIAIGLVVVEMATVFTNLQFNAALVRMRDVRDSHFDTAFTLALLRGVLLTVIVVAIANPMADAMKTPAVEPALLTLSLTLLLSGFANPRFVLFARELRFVQEASVTLAAQTATTLVGIATALVIADWRALAAGFVAGAVVRVVISYALAPRLPGLGLREWREFFAFGGWLTAAGIVRVITYRCDAFLITPTLGIAATGVYNVANRVSAMVTQQLTEPLLRAGFPGLAAVADDPERLSRGYRKAQSVVMATVLPIGVGTAVLAEDLVRVVVGPQWGEAVLLVQIAAPVLALGVLTAGARAMVMVQGDTRRLFLRNLINLFVRVPLIVVGLWLGGLIGAVIAAALASMVFLATTLQLVSRMTGDGVLTPLTSGWRSIVACVGMAAVAGAISALNMPAATTLDALVNVVVAGAPAALAYIGLHLGLWRLCGRPDGAERIVMDQIVGALRRRRRDASD